MRTLMLTPELDQSGPSVAGGSPPRSGLGRGSGQLSGPRTISLRPRRGRCRGTIPRLRCWSTRPHSCRKAQVRQLCRTAAVGPIPVPLLRPAHRLSRGELFEGSAALLGWADRPRRVEDVYCHCGRKATMTLRQGPAERPSTRACQGSKSEANERYVAMCRNFSSKR